MSNFNQQWIHSTIIDFRIPCIGQRKHLAFNRKKLLDTSSYNNRKHNILHQIRSFNIGLNKHRFILCNLMPTKSIGIDAFFCKMKCVLFIMAFWSLDIAGQTLTQNIRGRITDAQSMSALSNVLVEVEDSLSGKYTGKSDINGYYLISEVPTGRISIQASLEGFQLYQVSNLMHQSGKETVLDIEMFESVHDMKGATIKGKSKGQLNNTNISISAKAFDVEDTRRFAGSRNDPARMASNFAGVVGNNDSRNDIIIRGNSPQGLLWRMDGIDIPNPNHFGAMGASGGPVTILNNNVLAKSDFLTSAFPSMYGNAISGVFDLQMRNGNRNKHEFTGQIGFNGFEAGAEGLTKITPNNAAIKPLASPKTN